MSNLKMIVNACLPSVDNCEVPGPDVILNTSLVTAVMTSWKPMTLNQQNAENEENIILNVFITNI